MLQQPVSLTCPKNHTVPYIEVLSPVLSILLELFALGDKTDRLSQNVSKQLPKDQANVL
jgi:hypothetical protein